MSQPHCSIQRQVNAQMDVWEDTTTVLIINATTTMLTTLATLHPSSTQPPQSVLLCTAHKQLPTSMAQLASDAQLHTHTLTKPVGYVSTVQLAHC